MVLYQKLKKWCEHIQIYSNNYFLMDKLHPYDRITTAKNWKYCPICGKKKPK